MSSSRPDTRSHWPSESRASEADLHRAVEMIRSGCEAHTAAEILL